MKPRKLPASLYAWLHRLACPIDTRRSRSRSGRTRASGYFRPELQVLEDRCVLSTTSVNSTIRDASLSSKEAAAKPLAVITSTTKGATDADADREAAVIIWAENSWSAQGAIANSNVVFYADAASYSVIMMPLVRGTIGPQIAQITTYNVVISFPANSSTHAATTFQVTVAVETNRGIAWWSQTTHPSTNPPLALTGIGPTLSSVPSAQASTPVVLFLPPGSNATSEDAAPRPLLSMIISALAKDLVALETSEIPGARGSADYREAIFGGIQGARTGLRAPAETRHSLSLEPSRTVPSKPAPTRAELLALTERILADNAPAAEQEPDLKIGFSFRALLAFAAAEATWLTLRYLSTNRGPLPADDEEEHRVGIWKKPK
jgi:hypothetical protein